MARPTKEGLDYFPFDVDIDQNDKIQMIEAQHGVIGFAVVVKLLMKIYKEGYFYDWNTREQILFSKRVNVDINTVRDIVIECINENLFNKRLFDEYAVLTSRGIQSRYLEAVKRRKEVTFRKSLYLIEDAKKILGTSNIAVLLVDENGNGVNVDINPVDGDISTQSKVKERKEKKSNKTNPPAEPPPKESKPPKEPKTFTPETLDLTDHLIELMKLNNPNVKIPANLTKWHEEMDRLQRIDKYDYMQIRSVIDWCQADEFWKGNILSVPKLREKIDGLIVKVQQLHRPQGNRQLSSFERLQQMLKEEQDGQGPNNEANNDLFS